MENISADGTTLETSQSHKTLTKNLLPRPAWKSHPNYKSNTILLKSHQTFRSNSALIYNSIKSINPQTLRTPGNENPKLFKKFFVDWHAGQRSHERYEEVKLYPFLERLNRCDLKVLRREHEELHGYQDRVEGFETKIHLHGTEQVKNALSVLENAMNDYDKLLRVHLLEEEELVIPMLLEISVDEMEMFSELSLTELFDILMQKKNKRVSSERRRNKKLN